VPQRASEHHDPLRPEHAAAYAELDRHWAVAGLAPELRRRAIAAAAARADDGERDPPALPEQDADAVFTVAAAYDLAAQEGIDAMLRRRTDARSEALRFQLHAGATRAFELYRVLRFPADDGSTLLSTTVRIAAVGVVAGRSDDVRAWLDRQHLPLGAWTAPPDLPHELWDEALRLRLGAIWLTLLRGADVASAEQVIDALGALREARTTAEPELLASLDEEDRARVRFHLLVLYHLLDAAGLVAMHRARELHADAPARLAEHFRAARAAASADYAFAPAIAWLHVAAHRLVTRPGVQLEMPGLATP
jgi:hypothetical protein